MAVLTVSEAQEFLNITSGEFDSELATTIDAAEAAIAQRCGPLEPTSFTSRVFGNGGVLLLPHTPVVSLTSITPQYGAAMDVSGIYSDTLSGTLSYAGAGAFASYAHTVVYTAGRTVCPPDLLMAVKELVKHLWTTQRGSSKRPNSGGGDSYSNTIPGAAYAFPFRVEQLTAPHVQHGFA